MNDESLLPPEETTDPTGEPTSPPTEVSDLPADNWPLIDTEQIVDETEATYWEDFYGSEEPEFIEATSEPVTVEVIEAASLDICHSVLFSGFLICGTLVGCALLRKIYGT